MKTLKNSLVIFCTALSCILFITSCSKENSSTGTTGSSTTAVTATEAVAAGFNSSTNDSIYVIGTCARDHHLDSVAATSLPGSITGYLNTNYVGYTFQKAFSDKDSSGNITGYVVIIQYNGNPVGLKFDASGNL